MNLFKTIPFNFGAKDYEVRIYFDATTINMVVFRNNYPATGFRHQIQVSKKLSVDDLLKNSTLDELIDIAKSDITEKRWDRLLNVR